MTAITTDGLTCPVCGTEPEWRFRENSRFGGCNAELKCPYPSHFRVGVSYAFGNREPAQRKMIADWIKKIAERGEA